MPRASNATCAPATNEGFPCERPLETSPRASLAASTKVIKKSEEASDERAIRTNANVSDCSCPTFTGGKKHWCLGAKCIALWRTSSSDLFKGSLEYRDPITLATSVSGNMPPQHWGFEKDRPQRIDLDNET